MYAPAPPAHHCLIPVGDFALADGERFLELPRIGSERGLEKEYIVKSIPVFSVEGDKYIFAQVQAAEHILVPGDLCPGTTLVTPVKESAFRDPVLHFQCRCILKQLAIAGEQLGMAPAPFVDKLPEGAVNNCLAYAGDLGNGYVEVMESKEPFAVGCFLEFFSSVRPTHSAGTGEFGELVYFIATVGGHVAAVLCIEGISSGIEEVAAHRGRERKH